MRLTMKGATAKNTRYADKPNEDLFFFDEASTPTPAPPAAPTTPLPMPRRPYF